MEQLEKKELVSITFLVPIDLKEEIDNILAERKWKKSAFIRVSIRNELKRLAEGK